MPTLRAFVRKGPGVAAAKVLAAIGGASRDAIPELRWLLAQGESRLRASDPRAARDVLRDAIRTIEAAPR